MSYKKNFNFIIDVDTYNRDILFICGGKKYFKKVLKKHHKPKRKIKRVVNFSFKKYDSGIKFMTIDNEMYIHFSYLDRNNATSMDISNIVHECFHATSEILRRAGIEHTVKTEEAYSYLHAKIFRNCYDKMFN